MKKGGASPYHLREGSPDRNSGKSPQPRLKLNALIESQSVRLWATNHLRNLILAANSPLALNTKHHETSQWAISQLVTQLYDTDVEVCETAVKILEQACNVTHNLEFVVQCRPALDHLGEIGAPLLLRYVDLLHSRSEATHVDKGSCQLL